MKSIRKAGAMALLLTTGVACAQEKINTVSFLHHPESITTDGVYFYIAETGKDLQPDVKDGDGCIWKMNSIGIATQLVKDLDAPKGAVVQLHTVYVTDIDKVRGFDTRTGVKKFELSFAGESGFLNDLAVKDDSTLFLSATDNGKIYVVHTNGVPRYEVLPAAPIEGINGLAYDSKLKRLYANSFILNAAKVATGKIGYIPLTDPQLPFVPVATRPGIYDGLALLDDSTLVVTDWVAFGGGGLLLKVNISTGNVTTVNQNPISGPADFVIKNRAAYVPAMLTGDILYFRL